MRPVSCVAVALAVRERGSLRCAVSTRDAMKPDVSTALAIAATVSSATSSSASQKAQVWDGYEPSAHVEIEGRAGPEDPRRVDRHLGRGSWQQGDPLGAGASVRQRSEGQRPLAGPEPRNEGAQFRHVDEMRGRARLALVPGHAREG